MGLCPLNQLGWGPVQLLSHIRSEALSQSSRSFCGWLLWPGMESFRGLGWMVVRASHQALCFPTTSGSYTLNSSGASCSQNKSMSVGRGVFFPSAPAGKKAQGSDARRGHVLNRCFETLKRADGSQALKTATATQALAWPFSTLPTHVL